MSICLKDDEELAARKERLKKLMVRSIFDKSLFKIGDHVLLTKEKAREHMTVRLYLVCGVGLADSKDGKIVFDYSLRGYPWVCWEDEITIYTIKTM